MSIGHSIGVSSGRDPLNAWLCPGTGRFRVPPSVPLIETVGVRRPRTATLPLDPPQAPVALFTAAVVTSTNLVKHGLNLTIGRTESLFSQGTSSAASTTAQIVLLFGPDIHRTGNPSLACALCRLPSIPRKKRRSLRRCLVAPLSAQPGLEGAPCPSIRRTRHKGKPHVGPSTKFGN